MIRGQGTIKLYVVYNVLEVSDSKVWKSQKLLKTLFPGKKKKISYILEAKVQGSNNYCIYFKRIAPTLFIFFILRSNVLIFSLRVAKQTLPITYNFQV